MDVASMQKQCSEQYLSRPCHARPTSIAFLLSLKYVVTTSMPSLLRSYCPLIQPHPHYTFLTCSKLDRILHIHEDLTALLLVSTTFQLCLSSYCIHPIFRGRSYLKSLAECRLATSLISYSFQSMIFSF